MKRHPISPRKSPRRKKNSNARHVAFSVSAGCYTYQMGIASYLQKNFDLEDVFFSGASGKFKKNIAWTDIPITILLEIMLNLVPSQCHQIDANDPNIRIFLC